MRPNKADSTRNILVRPQAIKPKEALSYSVESSGTNSAVPQPVWKAALVLPVFLPIPPSLFPGSVRSVYRSVLSTQRTSFPDVPSICGRRREPSRPAVVGSEISEDSLADSAPVDCAAQPDYDPPSQTQSFCRESGDHDILALR